MTPFRGSDDQLEGEIAATEQIVRVRLGRVTRELRELERDLRELKRERARRNATASEPVAQESSESATV